MAVIINDFELVLDSPTPDATVAPAQPAPAQVKPEDVKRMAEHEAARAARVEAD